MKEKVFTDIAKLIHKYYFSKGFAYNLGNKTEMLNLAMKETDIL